MRKTLLRTLTVLTFSGFTLLLVTWTALPLWPQWSEAKQDLDDVKSKSLKEIAWERDVEVESRSELDVELTAGPGKLAEDSHAVILGRIVTARSEFTGNRHIDTYLSVEVLRVLKETDPGRWAARYGSMLPEPPGPLSTPLTVVRSGGVVHVNGHRAAVRVKGDQLITAGKEYVFFLEWSTNYRAYYLRGGASGAVLVEGGRVRPLTSEGEMRRRYNGAPLEQFIEAVLTAR